MTNIVIDTNVFVSALRSKRGASYRLLQITGTEKFDICLSVPLVLEYEYASKKLIGNGITLDEAEIDTVIDYLCNLSCG